MDLFPPFARTVHDSLVRVLERGPSAVFVADIDGEALWGKYLASFPPGTNPIFKQRTEHDCSCCKHFVRRAGAVVAIKDGQLRTIWDEAAVDAPGPYAVVAAAMRDAVRKVGIRDLFRVGTKEAQFGAQQTHSLAGKGNDAGAVTWNHFYTGEIPRTFRAAEPDTVRGEYRTTVQVFERGLTELTPDAVDSVLSLIQNNSLYRGEEHKRAVVEFQKVQRAYFAKEEGNSLDVAANAQSRFIWANAGSPVARFRNTAIGTYNKTVRRGEDIAIATLHVKDGRIARVEPGHPAIATSSISLWGLSTEQYVKVSTVMLSPNYWGDNAVGNKHTFFVLEGAKSDEDMRGFYNEFLHSRLEPHRKVFEVIGDKTKCQPTKGHLAGLGFSSTKKDSFLVRVQQGKKQRIFNVLVGG